MTSSESVLVLQKKNSLSDKLNFSGNVSFIKIQKIQKILHKNSQAFCLTIFIKKFKIELGIFKERIWQMQ